MARIRTIKPEFFTSEDIVSLTPMARLLYIALWCEADRDGRMLWKPRTFKMRYFPADDVDIHELCDQITTAGLVVLYGDGLAYVPQFERHQHVNPRETKSELPAPSVLKQQHTADFVAENTTQTTRAPRVSTRAYQDDDAQVGKERKGREGTRVDDDASPPALDLPADQGQPEQPENQTLQPPGQPPPPKVTLAGAVCVALKSVGMSQVNPGNLGLQKLIDDGAGLDVFVDAGRECVERGKGFAYLLATVQGRINDARAMANRATVACLQPGGLIPGAL
jgi:hypothetical protein